MLSSETQYNLREFFQIIGDYELSIEQLRQKLAANLDFEPYSAFMRLDRSNNKAIAADELLAFLHEN